MSRVPVNRITARVIAHATEDETKVMKALRTVLGDVLDEDDVNIEFMYAEGHHGNPITIIQVDLDKNKHLRKVLEHWEKNLPEEEREHMWEDIERRIDDKGNLYLRFDKQRAYMGELRLSEADDVIRVKVNLESYPASREGGMRTLKKLDAFSSEG
ncbi:MAG: hypothetical protein GXO28_03510 [Methanopyri archaeon]|nr:hypothetical protein [Methanopyri archaeon]